MKKLNQEDDLTLINEYDKELKISSLDYSFDTIKGNPIWKVFKLLSSILLLGILFRLVLYLAAVTLELFQVILGILIVLFIMLLYESIVFKKQTKEYILKKELQKRGLI